MLIRAWVLNFFGGAFASHRFASTRRGCTPVAEMGLGVLGVGVSGVMSLSLIYIASIIALALAGPAIVDVSHEVVV